MDFYSKDSKSGFQSMEYAQFIAFAPFVFQASKALRDFNILRVIEDSGDTGISLSDIVSKVNVSHYGVRVLVEAGLGIGLILLNDNKYTLTKTGYFILSDNLTKVNMDFTHDICYRALFTLKEGIETGKPDGLKTLGSWDTIYQGLSILPQQQKESWFNFDHYYSDGSFPEALPIVFEHQPKTMMDIGGNTGKWTIASLQYDPNIKVTIFDLPVQGNVAKKNLEELDLAHRVTFHFNNILDESLPFPKGYDVIWMSQFLDCFSDAEIISILKRCKSALNPGGKVIIMETFWDRQKFPAAAFSLQMTSLYFTSIANGNSQMYDSKVFIDLINQAGLEVEKSFDNIGNTHTILICK